MSSSSKVAGTSQIVKLQEEKHKSILEIVNNKTDVPLLQEEEGNYF